ncbi:MAG: hypothetical protein UY50_C0022G0023 [Parcubacteria group bacterium GW2011_GWA2_49_9]|nr:MAG: hypothetical protein UY50_C0022G0023 [Parcubacteria group bacterium GW2011_GWA2_49_9]
MLHYKELNGPLKQPYSFPFYPNLAGGIVALNMFGASIPLAILPADSQEAIQLRLLGILPVLSESALRRCLLLVRVTSISLLRKICRRDDRGSQFQKLEI